jgi:hypothetical protein
VTVVSIARVENGALPSIDRARAMLAEARSTNEVRKIRAVAQAVATLERGKEIAIDAAEIILQADARIGELTREMGDEKGPKGRPRKGAPSGNTFSRTAKLDVENLTRKQAAECEKVAKLNDSGDLKKYADACRKAGKAPTTKQAVALAKMDEDTRAEAISTIASPSVSTKSRQEWDAEAFLNEVSARFDQWAASWEKRKQRPDRLLRTMRLSLQNLEKRYGRDNVS